ncbi:hypothetical protein [Shouchella clausii]|uniref:hypothetical protein n=1 Tax=Shouchella clausii TaxID=79880 RepID=UPI000BA7C8D7|nr:hypothetical protein [Shouchella clausii]PAD19111.1 hypothetical protein CHH73_03345 [Shouchella clausii]
MEKSLIKLEDMLGEEGLETMLRSFTCSKNKDVEYFLHNKAIDFERQNRGRTTLVVDLGTGYIIGYFTLLTETFDFIDASGRKRQIIAGDKKATYFHCTLIGQFGRSDLYKGKVSGKEIMDDALYVCSIIKSYTATRIVCVEYSDEPALLSFYENNNFRILQRNENGLNMGFVKI